MNAFLFIGLPYAAIFIFLIGSLLRNQYYGYSVTSHSSQLLEGNYLYWGSRLFHSGIVVLLIGHLIGFLIPKSITVLVSRPLWSMVIEVTAFAFGILSMAGIIILIIRRIRFPRLYRVTSRLDIIVYIILFVQVLSGLGIAFLYRWGTSWYASSLVPWLRSLLILQPDISVIAQMPWLVRLHAASAFIFIGLIPFTRLMHFIVYPVYYLWRNVQVVTWNRDMKEMRASKNTREGIRPENN